MIYYIAVVVTLNLLALAVYVYTQRVYLLDHKRIGGLIAARLMERFEDADQMSEAGLKEYIRGKYLELCAAFGLPESAVNAVVEAGYKYVQPQVENEQREPIYS